MSLSPVSGLKEGTPAVSLAGHKKAAVNPLKTAIGGLFGYVQNPLTDAALVFDAVKGNSVFSLSSASTANALAHLTLHFILPHFLKKGVDYHSPKAVAILAAAGIALPNPQAYSEQTLIARSADVNAVDSRKRSPLALLLENNQNDDEATFAKAGLLMRASASIHAGDQNGNTPLLHAFRRATLQMRILLTQSQNPWIFDGDGNIHRFYNSIFPRQASVNDYLFPNWIRSIEDLIAPIAKLDADEEKQAPLAFPRDHPLAADHRFVPNDAASILEFLQRIPVFKEVWDEVNSDHVLNIR